MEDIAARAAEAFVTVNRIELSLDAADDYIAAPEHIRGMITLRNSAGISDSADMILFQVRTGCLWTPDKPIPPSKIKRSIPRDCLVKCEIAPLICKAEINHSCVGRGAPSIRFSRKEPWKSRLSCDKYPMLLRKSEGLIIVISTPSTGICHLSTEEILIGHAIAKIY